MGKIAINIATGNLQKSDTIVGIDLGTTNSLIAIVREDTKKAIALKEIDGLTLVPSVVHFDALGNPSVGTKASEKLISEPQNTIYSVKRLMGKSHKDVAIDSDSFAYKVIDDNEDTLVKIQIQDKFYSPIDLSSLILRELKSRAEHILKTPVSRAVITVPAYFNDTQRQATRDAGKLAGLDVLRIINEPTAAALAYGMGVRADEEKIIAVYDLGGGTFDMSILNIEGGICEVLATNGNTYLGGDDFDKAIVNLWVAKYNINSDKVLQQKLRLTAEEAKKHLNNHDTFEAVLADYKLSLSKAEFEEIVMPLILKTIDCCNNALKDASLTTAQIDEVVMVGGSTRMYLVKQKVKEFFGKQTLHDELNPDEVVALGAAIQADILAGNNSDLLLLDVTPLSLGIETMGGLMDVLIPRNNKIPTRIGRQYTTHVDGQSDMRISIFQGERDLVKDNRALATLKLKGIPAMPAGFPKIEVSFMINADGILKVTAKELRSGIEQSIEVSPKYGLTDEQMEAMLIDSLENATDDIQTRALVEASTEGQQMLETVAKFLRIHSAMLSVEEYTQTSQQMKVLEAAITAKEKNNIQTATEMLNEITRPFAERIMDSAIKQAMTGKKIM